MTIHSLQQLFVRLCLLLATALAVFPSITDQRSAASMPERKKSAQQEIVRKEKEQYAFWAAMGDMGSGDSHQKQVADQLRQAHDRIPFPFVLVLGDVIYPDGNLEKYGKSRFSDIYLPLLERSVLFKVALGNHDMVWHAPLEKTLAFYDMPNRYYSFRDTGQTVTFFALDTNNFDLTQQQWLDQALSQAKTPWKVVFGHHPVYSSGMHGSTATLQKYLEPLLVRHRVDLYLSGHDHHYERFKPIGGVQYVVSGGGGASIRKTLAPLAQSLVRRSIYHFLMFSNNRTQLTMQAIDAQGQTFDTLTLSKHTSALKKAS